jgi:anti-anti-sigma regulatory factor
MEAGWCEVERPSPELGVIVLHGEHDTATALDVAGELRGLAAERRSVVIDLSGTVLITSSIVNVIYRAQFELATRGLELVIQTGPDPTVRNILRLTRMTDSFPCANERADAVALARRSSAASTPSHSRHPA